MSEHLLNVTMSDGSRYFAELPQTASWYELNRHIETLGGAVVTGFLTDHVTEAWIDFSFRKHKFTINDQFGSYLFFVQNPSCPGEILEVVLNHSKLLLIGERSGSHPKGANS